MNNRLCMHTEQRVMEAAIPSSGVSSRCTIERGTGGSWRRVVVLMWQSYQSIGLVKDRHLKLYNLIL